MPREMDRKRHRVVYKTCQETGQTEVSVRDFDIVKSNIFILHGVRLVMIARVKTKTTQTTKICEFKKDTGSDGNLMPIWIFKVLFPNIKIDNLKK